MLKNHHPQRQAIKGLLKTQTRKREPLCLHCDTNSEPTSNSRQPHGRGKSTERPHRLHRQEELRNTSELEDGSMEIIQN